MKTIKNNKKVNTMEKESTLRNLYTPKEYDRETGAFIYEVFQIVAKQCKYHSEDMFEIDSEEEIYFELYNSEDYMAECMSDDDFFTYGKTIYSDGAIYILIHGHESNIGMMNWMGDFKQFETLTNNIMELVASEHGVNCVIRDKDFAKEQFDMVQRMVQKRKAA